MYLMQCWIVYDDLYFRPALCFILVYNCGLTVRNKRICYIMLPTVNFYHSLYTMLYLAVVRLMWHLWMTWTGAEALPSLFRSFGLRQCESNSYRLLFSLFIYCRVWLGSRVFSVLDLGTEGPGLKSQSRRCRVTVLGKLLTPIVPLFAKQQNW